MAESPAEYLLVCWDADNSVSVIASKAKGMISYVDNRVVYHWGKQGVFEGTVYFKLGWLAILATREIPLLILKIRL